jgi:hypothetical protein
LLSEDQELQFPKMFKELSSDLSAHVAPRRMDEKEASGFAESTSCDGKSIVKRKAVVLEQ